MFDVTIFDVAMLDLNRKIEDRHIEDLSNFRNGCNQLLRITALRVIVYLFCGA
jgi:hypothetical protein